MVYGAGVSNSSMYSDALSLIITNFVSLLSWSISSIFSIVTIVSGISSVDSSNDSVISKFSGGISKDWSFEVIISACIFSASAGSSIWILFWLVSFKTIVWIQLTDVPITISLWLKVDVVFCNSIGKRRTGSNLGSSCSMKCE